jgi:hypothetical protein
MNWLIFLIDKKGFCYCCCFIGGQRYRRGVRRKDSGLTFDGFFILINIFIHKILIMLLIDLYFFCRSLLPELFNRRWNCRDFPLPPPPYCHRKPWLSTKYGSFLMFVIQVYFKVYCLFYCLKSLRKFCCKVCVDLIFVFGIFFYSCRCLCLTGNSC